MLGLWVEGPVGGAGAEPRVDQGLSQETLHILLMSLCLSPNLIAFK